jgi:hypothetical protein
MLSIRRAAVADAGEVLTVQPAAFVTEAQLHDDVHMPPLTQTLAEVRAAIATSTVPVAVDRQRIVGSVGAPLGMIRYSVETGPRSAANVGLYERRGYRQVPNDSILIRLTKQREPAS